MSAERKVQDHIGVTGSVLYPSARFHCVARS